MRSNILNKEESKKINVNWHIKKIAITSIFLALAILTSLGTNFVKIGFLADFLSLDISLIFIIPLIFICSYYWAAFGAIVLSLFTFLWPGNIWIGVVFNLIVNITFVTLVWLFHKFINIKLISNKSLSLTINLVLSTLISSLFFTWLNGMLFQPLWWWFYGLSNNSVSFVEVAKLYNLGIISNSLLLWIPNYWGGIFALYISFNLLKFTIISIITFSLVMILFKSNIIERFNNIKKITY
ncbi:MAG: hypothetical protein RSE95_01900 [Malacoplasma sp.]